MHVEYNMATKTQMAGTCLEMKSYYEKLLKEGGGRAKRTGEETDYIYLVILCRGYMCNEIMSKLFQPYFSAWKLG